MKFHFQSYLLVSFVYVCIFVFDKINCEEWDKFDYKELDLDIGRDEDPTAPRNLIMMIPDGTSPNVFTMARTVVDPTLKKRLHIDDLLMGSIRTYSNTSFITDSAASATAYSTGYKTYDKSIGMDMNRKPIGTILEAAKAKGMVVGLIVTCTVTHATPASFAAHIDLRSKQMEIAAQYVNNKNLDFLLGGGKHYFNETQYQDLKKSGYEIVHDATELKNYHMKNKETGDLKLFGLFADGQMAFDVDRSRTNQPSLSEMTHRMLSLLKQNPKAKKNGFFIMIEGSRVDHGAHANDPVAMIHDLIQFDKTVAVVKNYIENNKNAAMISAADHGTGGVTIGRDGIYAWKPDVIKSSTMTSENIKKILLSMYNNSGIKNSPPICEEKLMEKIKYLINTHYNLGGLNDNTLINTKNAVRKLCSKPRVDPSVSSIGKAISDIISKEAMIGWTTGGHVGTDVNLYCYGPAKFERMCRGAHENTYVNYIMRTFLNANLQKETLRLRGF